MARENCDKLHFAGRRLPALANYFPKQVLKTILLSASIAFGALAPLAAEATSSCAHASFYGVGDGFHGLRAADGSRFDAHGLTTAHKTSPFWYAPVSDESCQQQKRDRHRDRQGTVYCRPLP
jgi:hypothetical protein